MKKIVFVMDLAQKHIDSVKSAAPEWEVIAGKDAAVWLPHLREAEIIGGWNEQVATECLSGVNSALRWIHNWGAGVDQLPFEPLKHRRIIVTNSSGVHAYPISETILALMLGLTRRLDAYIRNQQVKRWHHANLSLEMHGKTVGIIGVGAIGFETARLCKAFGMRVVGVRRSGLPEAHVDEMYDMDSLHQVLKHCDYVVNILPSTKETQQVFAREEFQIMKSTAFYFNVGRGDTTDENALIEALRSNQIAGAGLDVFAEEPLPADHPLWELENVIITPHTSGSTEHYNDRVMDIFLPNLESYLHGEEPTINRVDLDHQY